MFSLFLRCTAWGRRGVQGKDAERIRECKTRLKFFHSPLQLGLQVELVKQVELPLTRVDRAGRGP